MTRSAWMFSSSEPRDDSPHLALFWCLLHLLPTSKEQDFGRGHQAQHEFWCAQMALRLYSTRPRICRTGPCHLELLWLLQKRSFVRWRLVGQWNSSWDRTWWKQGKWISRRHWTRIRGVVISALSANCLPIFSNCLSTLNSSNPFANQAKGISQRQVIPEWTESSPSILPRQPSLLSWKLTNFEKLLDVLGNTYWACWGLDVEHCNNSRDQFMHFGGVELKDKHHVFKF